MHVRIWNYEGQMLCSNNWFFVHQNKKNNWFLCPRLSRAKGSVCLAPETDSAWDSCPLRSSCFLGRVWTVVSLSRDQDKNHMAGSDPNSASVLCLCQIQGDGTNEHSNVAASDLQLHVTELPERDPRTCMFTMKNWKLLQILTSWWTILRAHDLPASPLGFKFYNKLAPNRWSPN
jgi:hypothetical protein